MGGGRTLPLHQNTFYGIIEGFSDCLLVDSKLVGSLYVVGGLCGTLFSNKQDQKIKRDAKELKKIIHLLG